MSSSRVPSHLELQAPLIKPPVASFAQTASLYSYWRFAELLTGICSVFALILATVDYETHFDPDRGYDHCQSLHNEQTYRILIVCITLVAIVSLVFRYYAKKKWELSFLNSISSLPVNLSLYDILQPYKQSKFWTGERIFDILILLSTPFPYFEFDVFIPQRVPVGIGYETKFVCYSTSELLYCLMFLRIWILVKACFNYAVFQNDISKLYCRKMNISANRRFTFKSPLRTLFFIIFISFIWISLCLRVLERPYVNVSHFDFEAPTVSMWCVIVSLSTIGYGDVVPTTTLGQMLVSLTIIWGGLLFSLSVVVLSKEITMNHRQDRAYHMIRNAKKAASAIAAGYVYYKFKKQHGAHDSKTLTKYSKLRWEAKACKRYRDKYGTEIDDKFQEEVQHRLSQLTKQNEEIIRRLDALTSINRPTPGN
mmetsp:Transcript_29279/g.52401  ORF Transcript_29279/g.52401 Transcript_29279/m.52401 type:complete len:424 (+) Transcript_29279:5701-6972(+)